MANSRYNLMAELTKANVDFPSSATTSQLRNLLRTIVHSDGAYSSDTDTPADTNINDTTNAAHATNNAVSAAENAATTHLVATTNAATAVENAVTYSSDTATNATHSTSNAVSASGNAATIHLVATSNAATAVENAVTYSSHTATNAATTHVVTNANAVENAVTYSFDTVINTAHATNNVTTAVENALTYPAAIVTNAAYAFTNAINSASNVNYIADAVANTNTDPCYAGKSKPNLSSIDEEVLALKKRLEMLNLMQQIEAMEKSSITLGRRRLDFGDVEHALPKFSGDDIAYPVQHFIRDFEEILCTTGADDNFKLLALRRCLTGTARVFLSTTTALCYNALKSALTKEFSFAVGRQEVYKMLAQRGWKKKEETLHCYVLNMQAIAKRANIEESEVVDFIIDGIGNLVPNKHLLLTARTLDELKALISRYQNKYFAQGGQQSVQTAKNQVVSGARQRTELKPLCYNCSQNGHTKPNCPFPMRPDGSCFRCWKMGHDHRSCPNPKKVLKRKDEVGAVNADDEDFTEVGVYNYPG